MKNYINNNTILIINGPNLNMLGTRETSIYGINSLQELSSFLKTKVINKNIYLELFQSNYEGDIINKIHNAIKREIYFIIINPGALTHSSIAIRDALLSGPIKFIEVHITNIYSRESFRYKSYLSDIALGVISGLGFNSYYYALQEIIELIKKKSLISK